MSVRVGDVVHYVSYGTPNGEYPSVNRAAVVTATFREDPNLEVDCLHLCVLNPEGQFFNKDVPYGTRGGSWHFREELED